MTEEDPAPLQPTGPCPPFSCSLLEEIVASVSAPRAAHRVRGEISARLVWQSRELTELHQNNAGGSKDSAASARSYQGLRVHLSYAWNDPIPPSGQTPPEDGRIPAR